MPLIARVFHRTKDLHVDVQIADLPSFVGTIRTDGYFLNEHAFIPLADIRLICTYMGEMPKSGTVLSIVPKSPGDGA